MTENRSRSTEATAASDSLAQYRHEIGRHRLLTPAEEVRLAKRIEQGDVAAKNRMVESNLRLVVAVARAYAHRGVPLLDLIQEGTLGLIRAAEGFDWVGARSFPPMRCGGFAMRSTVPSGIRQTRSGCRFISTSGAAAWHGRSRPSSPS